MLFRARTATPDKLHDLVNSLPEAEWPVAERVLRALVDTSVPFLRALAQAPEDDEAETDAERAAILEAKQALTRGELLSNEELRREAAV